MVPGRGRLPEDDESEPEPVEVQMSRASLGQTGQHITLSLKPGASQVCLLTFECLYNLMKIKMMLLHGPGKLLLMNSLLQKQSTCFACDAKRQAL